MARAVRWDLVADPRRFQKGFRDAESTASRFAGGMKKVTGLIGGAFAGIAVTQVFKGFLDEGREAQKVGRQTAAVIKSTGGAAGLSAKGFENLAGKLSKYAAIDDEVIQGGENILATFTRIRAGGPDKVFERASMAALDMAASMGHGEVTADNLQAANLRLGKALNDPLKGMSALTKVGVTFSKQQREQIANFVEAGDTAKAQGVILDEVAREFGGSAGAAATGWDKFKVSLGNFQEFVGSALVPVIDRAGTFLADLVPQLEAFATSVAKKFGPALGDLTDKIQDKFDDFKLDAKEFTENLVASIKKTAQPLIDAFVESVKTGDWSKFGAALGEALQKVIGNGAELMTRAFSGVDWVEVGKQVGGHAFGFAVGFFSALFNDLIDTARKHPFDLTVALVSVLGIGKVGGVISKILGKIPFLKVFAPLFEGLNKLTKPINDAIGKLLRHFGEGFVEGLGRVFPKIGKFLDNLLTGTLLGGIKDKFKALRKAGVDLIHNLGVGIGEQFGWVTRNIAGVIKRLLSPFAGIARWLILRGRQLVQGLGEGIVAKLADVSAWVRRVVSAITSPFRGAINWLVQAGRNVLHGLWEGLVAKWEAVKKWFLGIPSWIKEHKGPLSLDRKLLFPAGAAIMGGFAKGLKSGAKDAMAFVTGIVGDIWGMLSAGFSGGNLKFSGGPVVDLGRNMAAQMGWTGAQWSALYQLVAHESGWNPQAQNPTSTAYGLFQFLNSTWSSTGIAKTSNPALQIAAGLNYIRSRYGDPINAWAFWQAHHWYGKGLEPSVFRRPTLIGVGERGPEAVSVTPLAKTGRGGIDYDRLGQAVARALQAQPPVVVVDDIHQGLRAKKRRQSGVALGLS